MNYYKGLEIIGKTGDFDKIPTELLHDYINDFTHEFNSRSLVKELNIAVVSTCFLLTNEQIETIADLFSRRECLVVEGQGTEWLLSHAFQLGMKAYRDLLNGC